MENLKKLKKAKISQKLSIVSIRDTDKSIPEVRFTIKSSLFKEIQERFRL